MTTQPPATPQPPTPNPSPTPVKLPFPLQDGETIIDLRRRHWWFLWPTTALLLALALIPLAVVWYILDQIGVRDDLGIFWWIAVALWLLYWIIRLIFNWYRYHHDIWVITNQRIIDSIKRHPFHLKVSTADLVNVQDISVDKSGLTPTMLNYGSVICETAGSGASDFVIAGVPHPESMQLLIDRERDRERGRVSGGGGTTGVPGTGV